jgi:FlaA1/EpsC-like NDP-sugar epimerase
MNNAISGRAILLTGAGGSIGSALAKTIVGFDPGLLILLDHSERNLHQINFDLLALRGCALHIPVLGDICDRALLEEILERYQPDIIIHAAAFKHVPLTERNPISAIRNNALGTNVLAEVTRSHGVGKLIMVSTDKAVNPVSIMGASKRVAELALLRWSNSKSQMRALRLGNVLGSEGSVAPAFAQQIAAGGPVTVTHPGVDRYFLSISETVELILLAACLQGPGGIFVPDLREPIKFLLLAHQMIEKAGFTTGKEIPIVFTGLRPGDKMTEEFISDFESEESGGDARLHHIRAPEIPSDKFDALVRDLSESVERRDLAGALAKLSRLVPEYRPTELLLGLPGSSSA